MGLVFGEQLRLGGGGLQLRNTRAHVSVQTPLYCKNATAPVYSGGIQAKSGKKLFM